MTSKESQLDVHFYLDNAPPDEVLAVLLVLSDGVARTPKQIAQDAQSLWNFTVQKDQTYSPRRLLDLGLAKLVAASSYEYMLSVTGQQIAKVTISNRLFAIDILHYLHFTPYAGISSAGGSSAEHFRTRRKYLWSYRRCCERIWDAGSLDDRRRLASAIQSDMLGDFPYIDFSKFTSGEGKRAGGRFNAVAVSAVVTWLRALTPSPIPEGKERKLLPRQVERFELALLALDDVYRARGYAYGDPVLIDEALVRQMAGVFFLDIECCERLLRLAARLLPRRLEIRDTLAGARVVLRGPYTVYDVVQSLG